MIIQTITFICDNCGKIEVVAKEICLYHDDYAVPPDGWDYSNADKFLCKKCLEKAES